MRTKSKKFTVVLLIFTLVFFMSSCIDGELDVSRLMEKPLDYTIPIGKNIAEKFQGVSPELMSEYAEYYVDINPVYGESLRITQVQLLPQLIMEAYKDENNTVEYDFKEKFKNKITVYNASNEKALEMQLASDGTLYGRLDKDSPVFRFPEYVYYAIEGTLWKLGDQEADTTETINSLIMPMDEWSPSMGESFVELRLEHDVKTMLYLMHGYSDAVFINYKIYSTLDLDRQYKIYMLLSYEGYEYSEETNEETGETYPTFWPRYGEVIPVQLVYSWVEGNIWALTDMKFAAYNDYNKFPEANIRKILPYLDTQDAIDDLTDTSIFEEELERQAMEYLSTIGNGHITVVDRK